MSAAAPHQDKNKKRIHFDLQLEAQGLPEVEQELLWLRWFLVCFAEESWRPAVMLQHQQSGVELCWRWVGWEPQGRGDVVLCTHHF